VVGLVTDLDGKLSADRARQGIVRQIGEAGGGLVTSSSEAVELESFFVPHEMGTIAGIKKIARHSACIPDCLQLRLNLG